MRFQNHILNKGGIPVYRGYRVVGCMYSGEWLQVIGSEDGKVAAAKSIRFFQNTG